MTAQPLLEVIDLQVHFPLRGGWFRRDRVIKAVDGVSFSISSGETFGLVGESGCGKTTTGAAVTRLLEPSAGTVQFGGQIINQLDPIALRQARREMQIVFQDPYASLNPKLTVAESIGEPLLVHGQAAGEALEQQVRSLLMTVGLDADAGERYPHQFSGGQRQRLVIARALALQPKLIVCDEPVSALDVSVQSQILNLLNQLQRDFGLAYLFISHDLSVVKHVSDRIGVMYLGRLVEVASSEILFNAPQHPYTQALIDAIPLPDPERQRLRQKHVLEGELPDPSSPPAGCSFHSRCPLKQAICLHEQPLLKPLKNGQHVACHLR